MDRREMIKQSCMACLAIGAGASVFSISSCTPLPIVKTEIKDKAAVIDPIVFKEGVTQVLVRVKQLEYDILVIKKGEKYHALYMQCTHQSAPLNSGSTKIRCAAHGSEFDLEGKVVTGPATKHLKIIPLETAENKIILKIGV